MWQVVRAGKKSSQLDIRQAARRKKKDVQVEGGEVELRTRSGFTNFAHSNLY
jgi:hypothetical protein